MTLGSNLDTLDSLRSSAKVLDPGEGESSAGLGKGSVIPNLALTASDRAVTSGFPIRIEGWPKVRPYDPEPHGWALGEEDPLSAGLDALLSGVRVLSVISVVILCPPCL